MLIPCDYCGTPVHKRRYQVERAKHHFCNLKCYGKYKKAHPDQFPIPVNKFKGNQLKKLLELAKKRKEYMRNER